jgi:hypothetical protein
MILICICMNDHQRIIAMDKIIRNNACHMKAKHTGNFMHSGSLVGKSIELVTGSKPGFVMSRLCYFPHNDQLVD